jgi:broad specificity phosphatase PhoE
MISVKQKWPANLVIVRHAESERNLWKDIAKAKGDLVYGGDVRDMDVALTARGVQQAIATGRGLASEFKFDRVFASPFIRTMQTAQLITKQFPYEIDIIEEERLREIDFGILDGLTKQGTAHKYPEEQERRLKLTKYHHRPPAGENYPDVALRLQTFLGTLTRETAGESVLVVCHAVVVSVFRKLLERLTERELMAIDDDKTMDVKNCSITHYAFDPSAGKSGKLVLRCYNKVCYVDSPEQSQVTGDAK